MPRSRKRWSFSAGGRGSTVAVYERQPGGPLYARAWDRHAGGGKGGWRRVSLGHSDRELARRYALGEAARLRDGTAEMAAGRVTLARVFALYQEHRTPRKARGEQKADKRRAELFVRFLGAEKDPLKITLNEWEALADARREGAIDARGVDVPVPSRRTVRERTVQADLVWLKLVLNWGTRWRDYEGRYLLREKCRPWLRAALGEERAPPRSYPGPVRALGGLRLPCNGNWRMELFPTRRPAPGLPRVTCWTS